MATPIYFESQTVHPGLLWGLTVPMFLFNTWFLVQTLNASGAPSEKWISGIVLMSTVVVTFALLAFLRLQIEVTRDGLFVQFAPFRRFEVKLDGLKAHRAVTYRPVAEYGGWGWRRLSAARGVAYNMRGNRGVRLDYEDGRHILIGSQEPEKLDRAIAQLLRSAS